ncbi:dihydroneopterin aldolase [Alkalibacter mobilis]|uniref:dihydroneopterin aldolase n=1 Tax=Alkalibacter mobilis TaxID=2787712 RepID=UPI0018A0C9A0|nr:dihydroneopterin aldolase [Alkalibacter mobilis]MBF7096955.1 dihydroneopterin aldolase [Alkalibacter mobilis]
MDSIVLNNMAFFGYHGVLEEEKRLGQKFFVDVKMYLDLALAGSSDDLNETVHYGIAYEKIKEQVEGARYELIEALAENISRVLFETFEKIQKVDVTVRKPQAPVPGIFDHMSVEISRERSK